MAKYQDGEHIPLVFDGPADWVLVKGWHDVEHCQAELLEYSGDDAMRVTHVTHKYGFWGVGLDEGEPRQLFYERKEPGRGRFKVTLAHVDGSLAGAS